MLFMLVEQPWITKKIVYNLKEIQNDKCDYFSMIMIKKNENDGILFNFEL
jgi:precorrin-2 methylase